MRELTDLRDVMHPRPCQPREILADGVDGVPKFSGTPPPCPCPIMFSREAHVSEVQVSSLS